MSLPTQMKITCPKCGKESDFTVWQSVNTSLDPDMKEKVLSRELFRFVCPHCGAETEIDYPFLYHQMEDKIMIYYVQDEEGYNDAVKALSGGASGENRDPVKPVMEGYLRRIVTSHNDLIEKIRIFDDGRDDRIIEIMKAYFVEPVAKENPDMGMFTFYYDGDREKISFVSISEEKACGTFDAPEGMYEDLAKDLDGKIMDVREEENFLIDFDWAVGMLMGGDGEVS